MRKITRFFGVDSTNEDQARTTWVERRRRLAIKKLGGVKVWISRAKDLIINPGLRKIFGLQTFSGNVKSGLSYLNIQIFLFIFDISIFHGRCDTRRELCINFLFLLNSVTRLYLTYFSLDQLRTALEEKDHKNFSFE